MALNLFICPSGQTPRTVIRAIRASQAYDDAYEMRRPVRPTQTAYIQVNHHSMPGYAATGSEPYYSEIPDPPPSVLVPNAPGND
jgi:hypothetical protein